MRRFVTIGLMAVMALIAVPASATPPTICVDRDVNDTRSTDGADFLTGTEGIDIVALGESGDQYFAFDGDDVLCGNEGPDLLVGEAGDDHLHGGIGEDRAVGLAGADVLYGGADADMLEGGNGPDALRSGVVDDARDELYDGPGSDIIVGNDEDVWYRCPDGNIDEHGGFTGLILGDPLC